MSESVHVAENAEGLRKESRGKRRQGGVYTWSCTCPVSNLNVDEVFRHRIGINSQIGHF